MSVVMSATPSTVLIRPKGMHDMTLRSAFRLLGAGILAAVALSAPTPAAAATTPQTIPALQQWTAGSGTYTFGAASRVLVNPAYASQLADEGQTLAEDLTTQ